MCRVFLRSNSYFSVFQCRSWRGKSSVVWTSDYEILPVCNKIWHYSSMVDIVNEHISWVQSCSFKISKHTSPVQRSCKYHGFVSMTSSPDGCLTGRGGGHCWICSIYWGPGTSCLSSGACCLGCTFQRWPAPSAATALTGAAWQWSSVCPETWTRSHQIFQKILWCYCCPPTTSLTSLTRPSENCITFRSWTCPTTTSRRSTVDRFKESLTAFSCWICPTITSRLFLKRPLPTFGQRSAFPTTPGTVSAPCRRFLGSYGWTRRQSTMWSATVLFRTNTQGNQSSRCWTQGSTSATFTIRPQM